MTATKRIVLNIVVTYGRSLFALVCGLFGGRWLLLSLGEVDFGLWGMLGGLMLFLSFFNSLLSTAVCRFYAVAMGRAQVNSFGIDECRAWFSTAVFVHTIVPIVLMLVGYPVGVWAICHWLVIPPDRISPCVAVFRYLCFSCFITMVSIPFSALYTAKQYIAELTLYSVLTDVLNLVFWGYMAFTPGDWLAPLGLWTCFVLSAQQLLICFRAIFVFPECRFSWRHAKELGRLRAIASFAGWQGFGGLGALLRMQGMAILVNKFFGARANASFAVASQVSNQSDKLSMSLVGAFSPAIMNAWGARDFPRVHSLAYQACKFATFLTLIFVLPLFLEIDEVLLLWLKDPPVYAAGLCRAILVTLVIDKTAVGHMMAVNACGRIAVYQVFLGGMLIATLPLAYVFVLCGGSIYTTGIALCLTISFCAWGRVGFAKGLVGLLPKDWFCRVALPILVLLFLSSGPAYGVMHVMPPSLGRLGLTTLVAESLLFSCAWLFLFSREERTFVVAKFRKMVNSHANL